MLIDRLKIWEAGIIGCMAGAVFGAPALAGQLDSSHPFLSSPDGSVLAVAGSDNSLALTDEDGKALAKIALAGRPQEVVFSPDGKLLGVSLDGGGCGVYQAGPSAGGTDVEKADHCSGLSWSQDGRRLRYAVVNSSPSGDTIVRTVEVRSFDTTTGKGKVLLSSKTQSGSPGGKRVHPLKEPPIMQGPSNLVPLPPHPSPSGAAPSASMQMPSMPAPPPAATAPLIAPGAAGSITGNSTKK